MTKLLDKAFAAAKQLPAPAQDNVARAILYFVENENEPEEIPAGHLAAVLEGLAQIERGEFATDEEVEAAFHSFEK